MKKLLLTLTAFCGLCSYAQAPAIEWQKNIGGSGWDEGYKIIQTQDEGFLVTTISSSTDHDISQPKGGGDIWLVKFNAEGNIEWEKSLGGSAIEYGMTSQTADGGYIVVGYTDSTDGDVTGNHGNADGWIVKLNTSGDIIWQKTYGGSEDDYFSKILQTNDGGYIALGLVNSNDGDITDYGGMQDIWVVKIDSEGILQWQKTFGESNQESQRDIKLTVDGGYIVLGKTTYSDSEVIDIRGFDDMLAIKLTDEGVVEWEAKLGRTGSDNPLYIEETIDGGYVVSGTVEYSGAIYGFKDIYVAKLDSGGAIEWEKIFGGSSIDEGLAKQTSDGGYIISGWTYSEDGDFNNSYNGSGDIAIIKLDASGNKTWAKTYGGDYLDNFRTPMNDYSYFFSDFNILQTNGGYVVLATTMSDDNGDIQGFNGLSDIWVFKINNIGNIIWQKPLGGSSQDINTELIGTQDGGYAILGSSYSNDMDINGNYGSIDTWVVKLGPDTMSVNGFESNAVVTYPNPANTFLNFQLTNNEAADKVQVYDISGKKVLEESSTRQIDVRALQKGLYVVQVNYQNSLYQTKFIKE